MKLPPIPQKMNVPDVESVRQLALAVTTRQGRREAHQLADYFESAIEVHQHNVDAAREALRMLREVLGEVAA